MPEIVPRRVPIRDGRAEVAGALLADYEHGASIRELSAATSRSYGCVRRLLLEAGADLRQRGGNNRRPR